jgi:hypothetical protein
VIFLTDVKPLPHRERMLTAILSKDLTSKRQGFQTGPRLVTFAARWA